MQKGKWSVDGCRTTRKGQQRSSMHSMLLVLGLFLVGFAAMLVAVPQHAAAQTFNSAGSALDPTTPWFYVMLIGIILVVIVLVAAALMRQIHVKATLGLVGVGCVLIIAARLGPLAFPAPSTACVAGWTVSGCSASSANPVSFSSIVNTGILQSGVSCNTITDVCTVDVVYNSTAAALYVAPKLGFTGSGSNTGEACGSSTACKTFVNLPFKLVRTDTYNATQAVTAVQNGIPTLTSTGSNPTAYAPIGYTAQTSSAPGTWQEKWSVGSLSGTFPSQNAPTVT